MMYEKTYYITTKGDIIVNNTGLLNIKEISGFGSGQSNIRCADFTHYIVDQNQIRCLFVDSYTYGSHSWPVRIKTEQPGIIRVKFKTNIAVLAKTLVKLWRNYLNRKRLVAGIKRCRCLRDLEWVPPLGNFPGGQKYQHYEHEWKKRRLQDNRS